MPSMSYIDIKSESCYRRLVDKIHLQKIYQMQVSYLHFVTFIDSTYRQCASQ